ncbi:MAG: cobalamin-dependent protein [Candidatus Omnitrophica bacterium]|nr:cobalamin-dependent protein [Candidatus Omnitrophota bacterium]
MKKIVLVNPPLTLEERYGALAKGGTSLPPLGLTILAAVIRKKNIPVSIVDAAVQGFSHEETLKEILSQKPAYVGFTAVTISIHKAAKLAKMIKAANPEIITLIGGPHLTAMPENTLELFPEFDIGVIGEGELTTIRLLDSLENKRPFGQIPGLVHRQNGKIVNTGRAELIDNLDTLPQDAWDLLPNFPLSYESSVHKLGRWPTTSFISSRGCLNQCRFCDNSIFGRKVRGYSAGYLIDTIKYLQKKYGIKDVFFNDDNFVMLRKRLIEFCNLLLKEQIDITWGCYSRIDNIPDVNLLKMMKKSGCWHIAFGLESGSQEILDFYNKHETLEQMEEVISWTKEAGIRCKGFFMLGNFLETEETLRKTIKFAKRIKLDDFHATFLTPLPGSELYNIADKYGSLERNWEKMNMWYPVFIPNGLNRKILEKYNKKAFLGFYLRPHIILGHIRDLKSIADIKKVFKAFYAVINLIFNKTRS